MGDMSREELAEIVRATVATAIQPLREDVKGLRAETTDLREDVKGLRAETTDLREDVKGLRAETTDLRGEFREETAAIRATVNRLEVAVTPIPELTRLVIDMKLSFPQQMREANRETEDRLISHIGHVQAQQKDLGQEQVVLNEQFRRHRRRQRKHAERLDAVAVKQGDHENRIQRLEEAAG